MIEFTDEQVDSAYRAAPPQVHQFIEEGKLLGVLELLTSALVLDEKQELHLAPLLRNSLIGLLGPQELEVSLKGVGMSPAQSAAVLEHLKEKVFPMFKGSIVSTAPVTTSTQPTPQGEPKKLELSPVHPSQQIPSKVVQLSVESPSVPVLPAKPASVITDATTRVRTMVTDVEAMQPKGKEARPVFETPHPTAPTDRPVLPALQASVVNAPKPSQVTEDLRKYGIDPYREPVE